MTFQTNCPFCHSTNKKSPLLIHEFKNSYWALGDHQYFEGYSILYLKKHARELHELDTKTQAELFDELMQAGKSIAKTYNPWKMNYASYGNLVEHIHWHIFPRYLSAPDHLQQPFLHADEFKKFPTDFKIAEKQIELIRKNLFGLHADRAI